MPSGPRKNQPKPPAHGPAVKAAAVAALLAGQSVSQVAREYNIPKGTVSNWKAIAAEHGVETEVHSERTQNDAASPPGESIGDLLVTLLRENIKGLISASKVLQDDGWVRQQDASELGVFMGITHDKVVRMLEAMDRSVGPTLPPPA